MTPVTYYSCPNCRKGLSAEAVRVEAGRLLSVCGKCRQTVVLKRDARCRTCGRPATRVFVRGAFSTTSVHWDFCCEEHARNYKSDRAKERRTLGALGFPVLGTLMIILGFTGRDKAEGNLPLGLILGALCWIPGIVMYLKRRKPGPEAPGDPGQDHP